MTEPISEPSNQELMYSPVLVTKNGKYYFHTRELNLVSKGDSLESAYKNLLKEQDEKLKLLKEIDGEDAVPLLERERQAPSNKLPHANFKLRVITDLFKYLVFGFILAAAFQYSIKSAIIEVREVAHSEILAAKKKIKAHILSPEKVERNNNTLREGIRNYRPTIEDLLDLVYQDKKAKQKTARDQISP